MKKQLIKEAFRLQQIAGLRPVNEIGFQNEAEGNQPSDELRQLVLKTVKPEFHDRIENSYEGLVKFLSARVTSAKMQGVSKDLYPKLINQLVQAKGIENYQDILKKYRAQNLDMLGDMAAKQPTSAVSILRDLDSLTQGLQEEQMGQADVDFEALIDQFILKIAQNYAEEGEDVEDYLGVAAEDAVELIRRKYRV